MNLPVTERADAALLALLAAAEPRDARPLGGLIDRLAAAGRIRGEFAPAARQRPISGIAYDSRRVVPGGLFVAVPGEHVDGHDFVARAVAAGAVAVLVEHEVPDTGSAAQLVVDRGRLALAVAAAWWYSDPGRALGVIGVTGTDGKTTTAAMAVAALEAAGIRTGLVSTADQRIGGQRADTPTHVTTPEAPELQRALRAMARAGDAAAVVETSSHGLALERVGELPYDVAILTNLTHEHLELHGTFEAYRDAKRSLFERLGVGAGTSPKLATLPGGRPWPRGGIVNLDDPSAGVFADATRGAGATVLTYGTRPGADVRATAIREAPGGIHATVATPRGDAEVTLPLVGRFNVHNALAVVALGELLGLDGGAICRGLAGFTGVRGRMERVDRGQPFLVVVDYAHTPAALATALDALAPLAGHRGGLVAVFGSAGERDVAKRAIQGRVAGDRCRLVIATDEDPRGEDPVAILEQIAEGAEAAGRRRDEDLLLIPDREAAIREAFGRARPGDVVLLAGKGNEREILYAGHEMAWDERAVAERLLAEMGFATDGRPSPS
jgi:UDP-N-acetylmuramoyl-L-alanyl-D-glutamate--2,6-diaminopimelate ligase